ncbi:MAG: hypothetical protein DLM59_17525 [Pseudonocardiales bacterium]|nr:MAG: hypothetical protein DLM59_17525 [Pseudonocardiales bacterium]
MIILASCLLLAVACRPPEPDAFAVTFHNDLGQPVWLALCTSDHSATCEHPSYRSRIAPGGSVPENIAPDVGTEWAVQDKDGRLISCVLLHWRHYPGHPQELLLSKAPPWSNPCPDTTSAATPST